MGGGGAPAVTLVRRAVLVVRRRFARDCKPGLGQCYCEEEEEPACAPLHVPTLPRIAATYHEVSMKRTSTALTA